MRITNKFLTPPWAKRRRLRKKSNGKKISRPPLARKHCQNGGPDADGNWDKAQKKRKTEKGEEEWVIARTNKTRVLRSISIGTLEHTCHNKVTLHLNPCCPEEKFVLTLNK